MDEQYIPDEEEQLQPSEEEIQKQQAKNAVTNIGKGIGKKALEAHGVPPGLSNLAVNKIANNPVVQQGLNKVVNNPLGNKALGNNGLSGGGLPPLNSPMGGMPSLGGGGLGGANNLTGNASETADTAQKLVNTAVKVKKYWPIISALAPILGWIFLGVIAIVLIMVPILFIQSQIEEVAEGLDKFINFITAQGWKSSEVLFFDKLQDEYNRYDQLSYKEAEFDIPLIAATIHYKRMVDSDSYSYNGKDKNTDYQYTYTDPVIPSNQLRSFYIKANNELGSAWTLISGQKRLIGHLIDTKFSYTCVNFPTGWEIFDPYKWEDVFAARIAAVSDFWKQLTYTVYDTGENIIQQNSILHIIRLITSYKKEGGDGYFISELKKLGYDVKENNVFGNVLRTIKNSDPVPTCGEKQFAVPVLKKFIDYEYYKKYLKEVYLPSQPYAQCNECEYKHASKQRQEELLDQWIQEIFDQRDAYNYLKGTSSGSYTTVYIAGDPRLPFNKSDSSNWPNVRRGFYNDECYVEGEFAGNGCPHQAVDIGLDTGDPIYAIANGKVMETGYGDRSGYYIYIWHDVDHDGKYDYSTSYLHLSKILVLDGTQIGGGQLIGQAGSTGNSTGPHLHFAISKISNNQKIDPSPILKAIADGQPNIFSSLTKDDI